MKSILAILLLLGFVSIVYDNSSKDYWQSVGPNWDQLLNPNKYKEQE